MYISCPIYSEPYFILELPQILLTEPGNIKTERGLLTKEYKCTDLIYYEFYDSIEEAIERETQLKRWKREWKEDVIKKLNPQLRDLYMTIQGMD